MATELKVPSAGESITEVTIVEWLKDEGGFADLDETIAVIETDKANVEVNAPVAGTLQKILKGAGETAEVGEVIGMMEPGERPAASASKRTEKPEQSDAAPSGSGAPASESPPPSGSSERSSIEEGGPTGSAPIEKASAASPTTTNDTSHAAFASPAVRRAMREHHVDLSGVSGSGPGGRITMADLQGLRAGPTVGPRGEERVAMTSLRKRIAERLVQSQNDAALLTTFNEVDMGPVMSLRKQYQDEFVSKHGIKLGFMSFFVKACIEALKEFPAINAEIDGNEIIYKDYYDIGVAVGGGRGLVVPVIRSAERLSFAQIEKTIADFGRRARDNKLKVEELQGGTFTISNGGVYGSLMSTPIINPPQSGILGMHAIQDRPVVRDGQVVPGKMMYLALTYDHRLVDGREAVTFLVKIKHLVEDPTRLLLEV
ncbi:MAG: 2-oxoglutarate dehydrogenase complex dihydrolipoyllysine-residue succinyltransferase [Myxococcota bacterium]